MNWTQTKNKWLVFALALVLAPGAFAAKEDVLGAWKINVDMAGTPIPADLEVTENDDGTLAGKLVSPQGEIVIEKITYEDGKISFTQTVDMGGSPMEFVFNGTITGDTVEGTLGTEMMGEMAVTGARADAMVTDGDVWALEIDSPLGLLEHKLIIGAGGAAQYDQDGAISLLENFEMNGNDIKFPINISGFDVTFELTKDGESIEGDVLMDGDPVASVTGTLMAAAGDDGELAPVTAEQLAQMTNLHGKWNLEIDSPLGLLEHILIVNADGTVQYDQDGQVAPLEQFATDGSKLSFPISIQGFDVVFVGSLIQGNIEGDFTLDGSPVAPVIGEKASE